MGKTFLKAAQRAVVAAAAVVACMGAQAAGQAPDYLFTMSAPAVPGSTFTLSWFDAGVEPATGFDEATVVVAFDSNVFSVVGATVGAVFGPGAAFTMPQPVEVQFDGGVVMNGFQYAISGNGSTEGAGDLGVFHVDLQVNAAVAPGTVSAVYFINPDESTLFGGTYYDFTSQGVAVTAVPEPATVASMLAGLALVGGLMARRRRVAGGAAA